MTSPETVVWRGGSGMQYNYYIYELPVNFDPRQDGNYIYTKVQNNSWIPIYIGQGDLGDRTNIYNHHKSACLMSKGATHIHVHLNAIWADRDSEEADLLAGHPSAYQPTGCNEKTGG